MGIVQRTGCAISEPVLVVNRFKVFAFADRALDEEQGALKSCLDLVGCCASALNLSIRAPIKVGSWGELCTVVDSMKQYPLDSSGNLIRITGGSNHN